VQEALSKMPNGGAANENAAPPHFIQAFLPIPFKNPIESMRAAQPCFHQMWKSRKILFQQFR
jgi:hypothetical protein